MKNKLKKSNSLDPHSIRPGRLFLHTLRLIGFALGLSVLLALFALLAIGLPPGLTNRITARIREAGVPLQVESIRLSTHRGWVLSNARLYSTSPDDLQPLLSAKKLYIMVWPVDWRNIAGGDWRIKLFVRDLGVSLGRPWENTLQGTHPFRTVSKLDATLTARSEHITVENAELQWGGVTILAHGTADFSDNAILAGGGETELQQSKADFRRSAAKAANALSQLQCKQAPQLNLSFNFNEARPDETFLEAFLSVGGITLQDRVYNQLSGAFGYRNNTWTLSALQLNRSNREQLTVRGEVNLANSNAQVSVESTLSAADLFSLLPEDAQSAVAQTGVKPYGKCDFTASFGPAPYDLLTEKVDVQVQQVQFKRDDLTVDPLALHFLRDGSRVELENIQARVNGGPVGGSFKFDLESKAWIARVQAQSNNPKPIGTLAGDDDLAEFISRFRFPAEPFKADLTISQAAPGANLFVAGTLSGDRFTCAGVPISHLETFMVYSNEVLNLNPLHITRTNEQFAGTVRVDFVNGLGFFNATNSFPPADIAHILAPDEHTVLEQFTFNGPVYAAGQGQLDYRHWTNHSFSGSFRAESIGFEKVQASLLHADIKGRGTQLIFTNASMQFYGGKAEGSAEFDLLLEDGSAPYSLNVGITGLNMEQMLEQISSGDYSHTRGQLSASINCTADAKAGFWKSVKGGGKVEIKDGRLADVPLFGGFSRLLQSAFPAFNLFSLTAFAADYELHDGAIWSENAQLGGTLVSARARGHFSPEKGLDFTIAAEPLRQTGSDKEKNQLQRLAATALKEGTAPLFRLLEFKLEGPLDKPEWRFVNLPKEVSDLPKEVSGLLRRSKDK
ncbi:MAG TPA: AsmA-like C-terminal region-containing protein [Pontiellaceae bacterium]|nr:AsmA-like C-terminal region-containing protein [Pontiellaceae bacterium]